MGMNRLGMSIPWSGCCQRASASSPTMGAVLDADDGLVGQQEVAARDPGSDVLAHEVVREQVGADLGPEHREASTSLAHRMPQRRVAVAQDVVHREARLDDPQAAAHRQWRKSELVRDVTQDPVRVRASELGCRGIDVAGDDDGA